MKCKYTVQRAIKRDGKHHEAGAPMWLTAEEAARLVQIGALAVARPTTAELEEAQQEAAERAAIAQELADKEAQALADQAAGAALRIEIDRATAAQAATDRLTADQAAGALLTLDVVAFMGDQAAVDQAAADQAAAAQAVADQAAADQAAATQAVADQAAADQAAAAQAVADQAAADQAAAVQAVKASAQGKPKAKGGRRK